MALSWQSRPAKGFWRITHLCHPTLGLGMQESHLAPSGAPQHEQRCNQPDNSQASNPADHAPNNGPSVAAAAAAVVGGCADAVLQNTAP